MEINKEKIRYILQFCYDKGENARKSAEIVNNVYGPDTVSVNHAQFWFRRFRTGNFDIKDAPRTGRPTVKNCDKIVEMIKVNPHVTCRNIADTLKIDHKTVLNHLRKAGFKKERDIWVAHELNIDESETVAAVKDQQMERIGEPEDIASDESFLDSVDAKKVTDETIVVSGRSPT